jgi:hypothetical protein
MCISNCLILRAEYRFDARRFKDLPAPTVRPYLNTVMVSTARKSGPQNFGLAFLSIET